MFTFSDLDFHWWTRQIIKMRMKAIVIRFNQYCILGDLVSSMSTYCSNNKPTCPADPHIFLGIFVTKIAPLLVEVVWWRIKFQKSVSVRIVDINSHLRMVRYGRWNIYNIQNWSTLCFVTGHWGVYLANGISNIVPNIMQPRRVYPLIIVLSKQICCVKVE